MVVGNGPGLVKFTSGLPANTTVTPFKGPIERGRDVEWPGVEWFFQAWKSTDPEVRERIRNAATWREAKSLGQRVRPLRAGWDTGEPVEEQVRIRVMLQGMRLKFEQHEEARVWLYGTGSRTIVEAREDPFWGIGADGQGPNWCGWCLMAVRREMMADDELPF